MALTAKRIAPAIACTLDADAAPERLASWTALLAHAHARFTVSDGALRVEFDDAVPVAQLATVVAAEQQCCAFFAFSITIDHRGVGLEVRAPAGAEAIVASLFGEPA